MEAQNISQTSNYLDQLNPPQREAVEHLDGPILVLAGAGSGKTRVLTYRIAHLILAHKVSPGRIMAVTFTNKATEEMRYRLNKILGGNADRLWVATFHSACLRILRRSASFLKYPNDFTVFDDNDCKQLLKQIFKELNVPTKDITPQYVSATIEQAKNSLVFPEEFAKRAKGYKHQICADIYDRYQKELRLANAMDFTDLLVNTLLLFKQEPGVLNQYRDSLDYILVDEFQDTNHIQYQLIKLLSAPKNNLLVVGDDDQSIYSFRGADVGNILTFEKDFKGTKVVKLEQNYRSSKAILEAAHTVISANKNRKDKKLWTESETGDFIQTYVAYDENGESAFVAREVKKLQAQGVQLKDIAVFYRTNAQSRALEEAFIDHALAYKIFGGFKFFDRKEVKDILAYLRMLVSDHDSQAFVRTLNTPARGIGDKALQTIVESAKANKCSLWQSAVQLSSSSKNLAGYCNLITTLRTVATQVPLAELIKQVLEQTGYLARLKEDKSAGSQSREENLLELQAIAKGMEASAGDIKQVLQNFLDRASLTASSDNPQEGGDANTSGAVSFMTLHLAKGLEFPYVFFTGLEEGLLPHNRALNSATDIEEERRLCYVGITRAMHRLYLTRAERRSMFSAGGANSGYNFRLVTRFTKDISEDYFKHHTTPFNTVEEQDDEQTSNTSNYSSNANTSFKSKSFSSFNWSKKSNATSTNVSASSKLAYLQNRHANSKALVKTADNLSSKVDTQISHVIANFSDILPGKRIIHPTFGQGTVVEIDQTSSKDLANCKVLISFDDEPDNSRKLILGKARLGLL